MLSNGKKTLGFIKNPLSIFFSQRFIHDISRHGKTHEVQRNLSLIETLTDLSVQMPRLYPTPADFEFIKPYQRKNYLCIAPASIWFTKQLTKEKWVELINKNVHKNSEIVIYLIGSKDDISLCENIITEVGKSNVINLAGRLSFLQSAALMKAV